MYMVSMWVCRVCHTDKSVYMYVHTYCVHIHTYVQCTFETPAACTVCRYIYIQYVMFVVYVYSRTSHIRAVWDQGVPVTVKVPVSMNPLVP